MVIKNGKAPARRKSASSSAKSSRSNTLSKGSANGQHVTDADELDGNIDHTETTAVENQTGDRILEETGIADGGSRDAVSAESVELTAITLIQPWASLIAAGQKVYETRDWPTSYRGPIAIHAGRKPKGKQELRDHDKVIASFDDLLTEDCPYSSVIAIAQITDCILMTEEFISQQTETELRCGNWQVGRYAFKLENVRAIAPIQAAGKQGLWKWSSDSWNPADFGDLHHVAEENGQLNLLEWVDEEPPDPDDYEFREEFVERYKKWAARQTDEAQEELENFGVQELCNQLMDGSTFAAESAQDSPLPESNCGEETPTTSASGTNIATQFLEEDTQTANSDLATSKQSSLQSHNSAVEYNLSLLARLAPHSQLMESDSDLKTVETVSPTYLEQSETCSQNSPSSKTSEDCLTAPIHQATKPEPISGFSSTAYTRSGSMQNGKLSAAPTLEAPGVDKESLLLRSPGALSTTKGRPPGLTRLENQLHQLVLIQDGEVVNPEFLEAGYQLPIGFTNLAENRTALELAQQQSIAPKSESLPVMAITAIDAQPSATLSIGELPLSDSSELNISISLPSNIGALTKVELISMVQEQHQLICVIERKEFELAIEKLHRVRLTGVYLQEFKKKCQYGEFENQLEQAGIGIRSAQQYMVIAKNWEIVEAKAKLVALLTEENQPAIGLKWALETVRDKKKSLKSAAAPIDPDCWQTPNTNDQPIVDLVKKALGGSIWLDPCSHPKSRIPVSVRYYKDGFDGDGLAENQIWNKTVFINPPFSDPFPWVEKCCLSIARGTCSAAIMLLKAGTLSNVGTGELINKYASAVCHWRGRIAFLNDEGNAVKGSDFDCIFVYFGDRLDLFRQAFNGRGTISTIDNHFSSVNKKFIETIPTVNSNGNGKNFTSVSDEQKELATAVGLTNGRSILPDTRDNDRERLERYDPHTITDSMMYTPAVIPKETTDLFQQAKRNCLADYVSKIEENLSEFSQAQINHLLEILNQEKSKRIDVVNIDF